MTDVPIRMLLGALADGGHPGEGEGRVAALVAPRLEVVAVVTVSKPRASASTANSTRSRGANCSAEAL